MYFASSLVVVVAIFGVILEKIEWPEAAVYFLIVAATWTGIIRFQGLPSTPYISVAIIGLTGIFVLFRVGLHNAPRS